MSKKLLPLAVSAALVGPLAVQADVTLYGSGRLSINRDDDGGTNSWMDSNDSKIGVKGSENLGGGLKAIFKFEWGFDPSNTKSGSNNNTLTDRDQWIGLQDNWGEIRFGSLPTAYKDAGKAIDPMYETSLQGRNFPSIQSRLHGSSGKYGGRETNAIRYDSPTFLGGLQVVGNFSFDGNDDSTQNDPAYGGGLHYKNGPIFLFADYINGNLNRQDDQAYKVGGKLDWGQFSVFGQYEWDNGLITASRVDAGELDLTGIPAGNEFDGDSADTWFAGLSYKIGNTMLIGEYGQQSDSNFSGVGVDTSRGESKGWVLAVRHWLSKRTDVYAGYANFNPNDKNDFEGTKCKDRVGDRCESRWTIGINHNF